MGQSCRDDEFWDDLIKKCLHCRMECKRSYVSPRCKSYCEFANCKARAGHHYDALVKKCLNCTEVCGKHPAECAPHCQTPPPPVIINKFLVTAHGSRPVEDSTVVLYSLLGLCMVLLLSSLPLALIVLFRGARGAKTPEPEPEEAAPSQECVTEPGQAAGQSGGPTGQSSRDFRANSIHPADRKPSDDSIPTETCVCIHCFPDLKALGQSNDRPPKASFSFYPQAVLHRAQTQKAGPIWSEGCSFGREVPEEAAVG